MAPECVPCLLKRCLYEARLVDPEKERDVIEEALKLVNDHFEEGAVSAEVATKVHKKVYEILETEDPYAEMKRASNETAEKLLPKAEKLALEQGFKGAALASVVGNVLDFGYRDDYDSPDFLTRMFDELVKEGFGYDDTEEIENILKKANNVIFFTDNTGEIVLDIPLLKKIKEYDVHLTVVVKGEPVLTDATMEDAERYNIVDIADQIETTGGFAVGVSMVQISETLRDKLEDADLIIAKGMANWEALSETNFSPMAFITRTKCNPVAESMGVPEEINVAKLFE